MGRVIRTNDTLQITVEQGFPAELDYSEHIKSNIKAEDFRDRIFEFRDKEGIRVYHSPPVRNFLVQNIGGKWLYWGLIHVLEVNHDYVKHSTSGKFKIIHVYSPEDMKKAHQLIDRNPNTDFFA